MGQVMQISNNASGIGTNPTRVNQGTISCPAASYATGTIGLSGAWVNSITGLNCRNALTGATSVATGSIGGGGGKQSTAPINCNGADGLAGFGWKSGWALMQLSGECRAQGAGSGYAKGNSGLGDGKFPWVAMVGDGDHWVKSVSGATGVEKNKQYLSNFGFDTLNFNKIRGYGGNSQSGASCCVGQDGSTECGEAKAGGLDCRGTLTNYCGQGDRVFTDGICTTAATNGGLDPAWARNQQMAWCQQGSNFNSDNCKAFCTAATGEVPTGGGTTQKEQCNQLYASQCSQPANKTLDICSCSLNWSDYPVEATSLIDKITGAPHEPMCYFSQCAQKGYLKTTKDKLACPKCIQSQNISITNATANLKDISQACNVSDSTGTTAAAANTAATSTPSGGTNSSTTGGSTVTPAASTPTPAAAPTPSTSTPSTPSTVTVTKSATPLIFVGAGVGVFLLLTVVAIAATKK
ncbi:hypothetical protein ABBQ32_011354 [Trebouxia sp. C0010 RCD-2024]